MIAWWLVLSSAYAGTLHLTLDVQADPPTVRHAIVLDGPTPPSPALGPLSVTDARGQVLATAPLPLADPHRSIAYPEAFGDGPGEAAEVPGAFVRTRVPWPDGAAALRLHGQPLVLPDASPHPGLGGLRDADLVTLRGEEDPARALDLLILSEGYRAADRQDFLDDAQTVVDHLLDLEPWGDYRRMYNVHAGFVESVDGGIDAGPRTNSVDSAFQCHYGCSGLDRLICCNEARVVDAVAEVFPEADGVLLLIDDVPYGGSGGITYSTSYTGPYLRSVSAHELGHTLVQLWDEYDYGLEDNAGTAPGPNCSPPDLDPLPWEAWVGTDGVDGFPVCSFTSWLRPTDQSCMMHSLQDRYCPVCREHVVTALYRARGDGPVESTTPEPGALVVTPASPLTVTLDVVSPPHHTVVTWSLDDEPVEASGLTADLGCPRGATRLTATVRDETSWVRDDQGTTMDNTLSWTLDTTACPSAADEGRRCGCASGPRPHPAWALPLALALLVRRRRHGARA